MTGVIGIIYIYIYYMQCIPIYYLGYLSGEGGGVWGRDGVWGMGVSGEVGDREIRRVCWSCRPEIWQATRQSCRRDACSISGRLEKSEAQISQPRLNGYWNGKFKWVPGSVYLRRVGVPILLWTVSENSVLKWRVTCVAKIVTTSWNI